MINEEITDKDVNLAVRIGGVTARELKNAIGKLIAKLTEKRPEAGAGSREPELKHGKMTHRQLKRHNDGLTPLELASPNLRLLHREMKRAKIDFAVEKDGKGRYVLYFKGKDADEMTRAFKRYTDKLVKHEKGGPSIGATLDEAKKEAQALNAGRGKEKKQERGAR